MTCLPTDRFPVSSHSVGGIGIAGDGNRWNRIGNWAGTVGNRSGTNGDREPLGNRCGNRSRQTLVLTLERSDHLKVTTVPDLTSPPRRTKITSTPQLGSDQKRTHPRPSN